MKIAAPGGETVDLHRRAWIGPRGTRRGRLPPRARSRLRSRRRPELAFPLDLRGPGPEDRLPICTVDFSPQEIVGASTHLARACPRVARRQQGPWELRLGGRKVTNVSARSRCKARPPACFHEHPPRVRAEMRAGTAVISEQVSASYGFEEATRDVQLRLDDVWLRRARAERCLTRLR